MESKSESKSKSNSKCFTSKRPLTRFLPEPYAKRHRVEQGVDWCRDIYDIASIDGVLCFVLDVQPLAVAFEKEHPVLYTDPAGTTFLNPPSCETTDNCLGMNWNKWAKDSCLTGHTLVPSTGSIKSRTQSDGLSKTVDHQEILDQTDHSIEVDQTICSDVEYSIEENGEGDGEWGASKDLGACFLRRRFDVIRDLPKGCGPPAEDNCPTNYTLKPSNRSVNSSCGFSKTADHREILDQTKNSIKTDQLTICSDSEYSIEEYDEDDSNDEGVSKDVGACLLRRRFDVIRDFPKGCGARAEDNCPTNNSFKPPSGSIKSCTHSYGFSKGVDHREILDQADNSIEADHRICSDDEYRIEGYDEDGGDDGDSKDLGA